MVALFQSFARGPVGRVVQLLAAIFLAITLGISAYSAAVLRAVPQIDMPASYKWLLLRDIAPAPRIIIEGGSSGHHGIDSDALSQALGVTAINIADNAGYDLNDKIARLESFARPGDTVVLQLEWSYYLRNTLTDDYLNVLFTGLPDYITTLSTANKLRRAMSIPAPVLWQVMHSPQEATPVLSPAQQLDIAALQGASGHVSYATARPAAAGVEGQSCDSYLFSDALKQGKLAPSPLFLTALHRLQGLSAKGVQVLFAWPIVAGDDCYTSDVGLPALHDQLQNAVEAAGFHFLGAMTDTVFVSDLRDDTPYHLITKGATRRTDLLIAALKAAGVTGAGGVDLRGLARADILGYELRAMDPPEMTPLPLDAPLAIAAVPEAQLRFTAGWWQDEASGRWMRGKEAVLTLALSPDLAQDRALRLAGFTFDGQSRRLGVFYEGRALGQADVKGEFELPIVTAGVPRGKPVRVTLRLLDDVPPQSPTDLGQGDDVRSLTLHLRSLSLTLPEVAAPSVANLPVPLTETCATDTQAGICQTPAILTDADKAEDLVLPSRVAFTDAPLAPQVRLIGGWWQQEAGGRWIGAQDAAIKVHPGAQQGAIGLRISAIPFNAARMPVEISAAGKLLFKGDMTADAPISLILPGALAGQDVTLVLHFPTADLHCPTSLGLAEDARSLLAFVREIEVFAPGVSG